MAKDYTRLFNQPKEVRAYIAQRAANHDGLTPQEFFDEIPDHLKDDPRELMDYLSDYGDGIAVQISHIQSKKDYPELSGDPDNIVLEVSGGDYGYPNQARGANAMTEAEVENANVQTWEYAQSIEDRYTDDLSSNLTPDQVSDSFTSHLETNTDLAISHNYDGLADSIYVGLEGIAQTVGVACTYSLMKTYTPRIIALFHYIVRHRVELVNSQSQREKLIRDYIMPMIKREDADQVGSAFIVGLLLTLVPGIKGLLVAYGLVSLCKLAIPFVKKFVLYLERNFPALARLINWVVMKIDKLVDLIHSILDTLWQVVEKTVQVAKDCLVSFFNWGWDMVRRLFGGDQLGYA